MLLCNFLLCKQYQLKNEHCKNVCKASVAGKILHINIKQMSWRILLKKPIKGSLRDLGLEHMKHSWKNWANTTYTTTYSVQSLSGVDSVLKVVESMQIHCSCGDSMVKVLIMVQMGGCSQLRFGMVRQLYPTAAMCFFK